VPVIYIEQRRKRPNYTAKTSGRVPTFISSHRNDGPYVPLKLALFVQLGFKHVPMNVNFTKVKGETSPIYTTMREKRICSIFYNESNKLLCFFLSQKMAVSPQFCMQGPIASLLSEVPRGEAFSLPSWRARVAQMLPQEDVMPRDLLEPWPPLKRTHHRLLESSSDLACGVCHQNALEALTGDKASQLAVTAT